MQNALFTTEAEIRDQFMTALKSGEQQDCPVCGRFAMMYKYKVNSTIARQLINFYLKGGDKEYMHCSSVSTNIGPSNFSYGKYWGILERLENTDDPTKKHSGFWRMTQKGVDYVTGKIMLPKYAMVYSDELFGFSEEMQGIQDALGDKFNYEELMQGI